MTVAPPPRLQLELHLGRPFGGVGRELHQPAAALLRGVLGNAEEAQQIVEQRLIARLDAHRPQLRLEVFVLRITGGAGSGIVARIP